MNTLPHHAELSIVVPVYNSAAIFPELHRRLHNALRDQISSLEIIAVLDGCSDNSFDVIAALAQQDSRIKIVEFSRNFGHQAAVTAGLEFASGDYILVMDDDLEDPPEVLPNFIAAIRQGFDVVYGVRKTRQRSILHRALYSLFYRILGKLADISIPYDAGDFCIMRRNVVETLNRMPENNRFLRGLRAWSGFRQIGLEYHRGGRYAGEPGYSFRKYIALAMNGIFSFSYKPLNYIALVGAVIAMISFVLGTLFIVLKLAGRIPDVPGWTSLAVLILFLSGVQMISNGITGAYISRIYDEVKHRPKYVVSRLQGFDRTGEK